MAKKMRSVIIQKNTEMSTNAKFLWMLILLLVIIAVIGTSIDISGETTRQRTLTTKTAETLGEKINYEQLEQLLPTTGTIILKQGSLTNSGRFSTIRIATYHAEKNKEYQELQATLQQLEEDQRTFQITIKGKTYLVRP